MHTLLMSVSLIVVVVLFIGMVNYNTTAFVAGLIGCITVGLIHVYRGLKGWD